MFLVFERSKRKRKKRQYGPIVIRDGAAYINVVDGRASSRRPPPPPRGTFPKELPCHVCGEPFLANSGGAAYCSDDCRRRRREDDAIAQEIQLARASRARPRRRSRVA